MPEVSCPRCGRKLDLVAAGLYCMKCDILLDKETLIEKTTQPRPAWTTPLSPTTVSRYDVFEPVVVLFLLLVGAGIFTLLFELIVLRYLSEKRFYELWELNCSYGGECTYSTLYTVEVYGLQLAARYGPAIIMWVIGLSYLSRNAHKFGTPSHWFAGFLMLPLGYFLHVRDLWKRYKTPSAVPAVTAPPTEDKPATHETKVAQQTATKFCRECGSKIPRESKYCEKCGTKLT